MSARYTGGLVYNAPGGWSGQFNGTTSNLSLPYSANYVPGTGDFTVECWVNFSDISTNMRRLFGLGYGANGSGPVTTTWQIVYMGSEGSNQLRFYTYNGSTETFYTTSGFSPVNGQWYHVAVSRTGGNLYIFVNGVALYSAANSFNFSAINTSDPFLVGLGYYGPQSGMNGPRYFPGYISNIRFIKGTGIYSANFTPPSGRLAAITNTQLLLCQSPTFVDNSSNAATVTNNSATVSTVNPFPTSQLPNPALGNAGNGVYTMSQYAALKAANLWPAFDPFYRNVTLNLHGNAGTVLPFNTDASTNNFQVTQVGNTSPSNWTPFAGTGYYSNYFDGSGDYLTTASNTALQAGTGAFTLEGWIYITGTTSGSILSQIPDVTGGYGVGIAYAAGSNTLLGVITTTSTNAWNASITPVKNTWYHMAFVRDASTNIALFINGTKITPTVGGSTNTTNITTSTNFVSGAYYYDNPTRATYQLGGYVSNARFVKGTAVYDPTASSITVPTTPLTAVSGTSLLTCQSNRFIDNSTNAFAITVSGNTAVNPLQPFTAPTGTSAYGSGYFDGSGDYLRAPTGYLTGVTTGNFTVEGWWNFGDFTVRTTYFQRLWSFGTGLANDVTLNVDTSGNLVFRVNDSIIASQSSGAMKLNSWNHVALVRSSGTVTIYLNGTSVASAANSSNISGQAGNSFYLGCESDGAGGYFYGYCSNVRITNTAVYTTTFTPSTTPLTAISGTSLLTVQTNAPSQNNTFLDSSTNNFVITRNGNTTQGTFTPYGSNWSNYIGASNYLYFANNAALSFGTGDFCVEAYVYKTIAANEAIIDSRATQTATPWAIYVDGSNFPYFYEGTSYTSTTAITLNAWNHVAVTRSSGTLRIFVNGVQGYSATVTTNLDRSSGFQLIGANVTGGANYWNGYISNLRIVKGSAVYTSAFTPSTTPLTAISGTSLLTCQSNRFIDNSSNAFALTVFGSPSVQRFSPFSPTTAYSTSVIGGSGYFDGSGDYLTTNYTINWSTYGSYTLEFWVYHTTMSPTNQMYFAGGTGGTGNTIFYNYANGRVGLGINGTNEIVSSSGVIKANTWQHIAYTFNGTTTIVYVDGVQVASGTTAVYANSSVALAVGGGSASSSFVMNGYIANMRLSQSVIYSSAFTPPTSPVTGGSLLLNYTNAGILDNAMMNDLETVGNAQISTSVKKYGSASMYFDGAGDYISTATAPIYQFGSANFTIEFWFYQISRTAGEYDAIFRLNGAGTGFSADMYMTIGAGASGYALAVGNNARNGWAVLLNPTGGLPSLGVWHHMAIVRNGSTWTVYLDGSSVGTATYSGTVNTPTGPFQIGWAGTSDSYWDGYIDDFRVTNGIARYTTTFTPPTSQVQDQ